MSKTCSVCLLFFPPLPSSSWYFFCRGWRKRLLRCLQRSSVSNMQRRGKRQTIILESRPGKWDKMSIPLLTKSLFWRENKNTAGIQFSTRTGKWGQEYPSFLLDFSLFLGSQTPVLEISKLPFEWNDMVLCSKFDFSFFFVFAASCHRGIKFCHWAGRNSTWILKR